MKKEPACRGLPKKEADPGPTPPLQLFHVVFLLETLDSAAALRRLLLSGIERMASGTDFNTQLLLCGTRLEGIAAGASYNRFFIVFRVNSLFHVLTSLRMFFTSYDGSL